MDPDNHDTAYGDYIRDVHNKSIEESCFTPM